MQNSLSALVLTGVLLGGCGVEVSIGSSLPRVDPVPDDPSDLDQDGYSVADGDCDDLDATRAPGLDEACDGIDNDCDGTIDGHDGTEEGIVCERVDTFTQTLMLDLLFIVDSDPTMSTHRDDLAEAVKVMTPYLIGDSRDTHIGVVTMDMMSSLHQGRLVDAYGDRWVSGTSHSPASAELWLDVALTGDVSPPGTAAGGRAALREAITTHLDGHNSGFLRGDAALAVMFLSNRDDPNPSPDAESLWQSLAYVKDGSLGRTSTYAIVQDDELDCKGGDAPERMGDAYLELSGSLSPTRGNSMSVCALPETLEGFLEAEAQDLSWEGVNRIFELTEPPVVESLVVTIDDGFGEVVLDQGVSLATDGVTVVIDNPPPPGVTVRVSYRRVPTL